MTLWTPQYRTIDVPVYGNPGEVDQMEVEIDAPPEPDEDWDDVPGTAYDDFHPTTYLYGTE